MNDVLVSELPLSIQELAFWVLTISLRHLRLKGHGEAHPKNIFCKCCLIPVISCPAYVCWQHMAQQQEEINLARQLEVRDTAGHSSIIFWWLKYLSGCHVFKTFLIPIWSDITLKWRINLEGTWLWSDVLPLKGHDWSDVLTLKWHNCEVTYYPWRDITLKWRITPEGT
jgi:hypothetical protein